jgi:hypothetical protein
MGLFIDGDDQPSMAKWLVTWEWTRVILRYGRPYYHAYATLDAEVLCKRVFKEYIQVEYLQLFITENNESCLVWMSFLQGRFHIISFRNDSTSAASDGTEQILASLSDS